MWPESSKRIFAPGKYSIGLCDHFTPPGYEPTAIADALPVEFKAGEKQVVTLKLKKIEPQAAVPEKNQAAPIPVTDPRTIFLRHTQRPTALSALHCQKDQRSSRSLRETIEQFNLTSQKSPTGVLQAPITEQETREAMRSLRLRSTCRKRCELDLEQILKSGELPSNVYFRRFTRFDDGKQMQHVWWVRLVVETGNTFVYSVPVRSKSLSARPYTQMERQQNASQNISLLNRVSSYVDYAKVTDIHDDAFFGEDIPKVRDSEIERFLGQAKTALRTVM